MNIFPFKVYYHIMEILIYSNYNFTDTLIYHRENIWAFLYYEPEQKTRPF